MRIRAGIIEYNLNEAAQMLGLSPTELRRRVKEGNLKYYYQLRAQGYRFHEASLITNRELLIQRGQSNTPYDDGYRLARENSNVI